MISLSRLVLAAVFLLGIWIDPTQPSRLAGQAYAVLAAYLLASAAYFAATWDDWRLEARFAGAAHAVDIAVFGIIVFLTEGYTSPFFPFFVFILLSAAMKWGRRGTMVTGGIVTLLFFAAGLLALELGYGGFATRQFIFRGSYLVVLSLVIVWFGVHLRADRMTKPLDLDPGLGRPSADPPMAQALDHALDAIGARRGLCVWWDKEEPWVNVASRGADGGKATERLPPDAFARLVDPRLADHCFLFDAKGRGALVRLGPRRAILSALDPVDPGLSARFAVGSGLCIPFDTDACTGIILALDVPGLCSDDLDTGERLGLQTSAALRRRSLVRLTEESAADRTRVALARDLHDGIAQLLAGTSMRLEAVKRLTGDAEAVAREIETLQREIETEQRGLRGLIGRLRDGQAKSSTVSAREGLDALAERLSRQWGIVCRQAPCEGVPVLAPGLEHELHHLVREAVANAVRHGGASEVRLSLEVAEGAAVLAVEDNGTGFVNCPAAPPEPRSISERAALLGGGLQLESGPGGSRLLITLPLEGPP